MELVRTFLFLLLMMAYTVVAEAKTSMRRAPREGDLKALQVEKASSDKAHISPFLEPKSDKKFFEKDYPWDKRAKVDPKAFHFKHPYPVVQDSSDYDKDFVKDENSDNGSWKAQETYDRLRAKLAKEKRDLAKALAKKQEEEQEMREAMQRHEQEEKDRDEAARKVEDMKRRHAEEEARRDAHHEEEAKKPPAKKEPVIRNPFVPKPKPEVKEVDVSTEETEKAMDNLEECKKQLAKARQDLKDLMNELEEAKKKQNAANAALDEALSNERLAKEHHTGLKKKVKSEYEEYEEARQAYEKQKALVDKLEGDIKVAAAKVKSIRDSADKDGGVYPTPGQGHHKNNAFAAHWMWGLVLALAAACSA